MSGVQVVGGKKWLGRDAAAGVVVQRVGECVWILVYGHTVLPVSTGQLATGNPLPDRNLGLRIQPMTRH